MIDGQTLVENEGNCYNCGCNLRKACPGCKDQPSGVKVKVGTCTPEGGDELNKVRVHRLRENAIMPERAHPTDAGADLRFAPEDSSSLASLNIAPSERALIPTGLRIEVPTGHMLEIKNKSGLSLKSGLHVGGGVVDQGYTGEVKVILHNVGHNCVRIRPGQKIAQAVFVQITTDLEFEEQEEIYDSESSSARQSGGFGSTGV